MLGLLVNFRLEDLNMKINKRSDSAKESYSSSRSSSKNGGGCGCGCSHSAPEAEEMDVTISE